MNKKQKKPKISRRNLIRGLSILAIAVVLAVVGTYVYKQNQYVKTTDSAKYFSFSYPKSWQIEPYIWEDCCEGPPKQEPDWSKETKPITLHPVNDKKVSISFMVDRYGDFWKSYNDLKAYVKEDYFAKILFEGTRSDGHEALFSKVDYLGPPDAKVESFTDHRYYFDNGKTLLRVEFREKYHHDWPDDDVNPDINNTQYLPDFEHIAKSIKFLK